MEILIEHLMYIDECVQFCQTYVPSHVHPWVPHTDSLGAKALNKEVAGSAVPKGANICVKVQRGGSPGICCLKAHVTGPSWVLQ